MSRDKTTVITGSFTALAKDGSFYYDITGTHISQRAEWAARGWTRAGQYYRLICVPMIS